MLDREKVVKGLEYCSTHDCSILCPYWFGCDTHSLAKDALELLKEQATRPVYNGRHWECEKCGEKYKDILVVKEYKHCPGCGRRIEWV